jgi:hypothetical protein
MRLLRLPLHIAVATLYTASIGVGSAAIVAVLAQRLDHGARAGIAALLIASACFGTYLWRTHRPQRARPVAIASEPEIEAEPIPLRAAA